MSDCMYFPNTVEEFMEQYKMTDTKQVYSNGTEYVPIFRMEQWFEHEKAKLSQEGTTSDTISRQAAIDALNEYFARIGKLKRRGLTEGEKAISLDTVGAIKTLPSAQPEPKWIPISDRLPRDGSWNIFTDGKNISVERYKADAIDHFFPNGRWFQLEDVIAWMPLPDPYKE